MPDPQATLFRRFLCWIGLHDWLKRGLAQPEDHRRCIYCPKRQRWLYDLWVDT